MTTANFLPSGAKSEIDRLKPQEIIVIGGTGTVSNSTVSTLKGLAPKVTRLSGANRYDTSLAIARHGWSKTSKAFIATGRNFPDALGGSALAAAKKAPVLLTTSTGYQRQ